MEVMEGGVFQSNRTPVRLDQISIQPFCELWGVANGCGERDDLSVGFDVSKSRKVDLKRGPSSAVVHQVEFVCDHAAKIGDEFSPMTKQRVQFFRGTHKDIALIDVLGFSRGVSDAQTDREPHRITKFTQILVFLHRQSLEWNDVDGF